MLSATRQPLGQLLLSRGLVLSSQIESALQTQRQGKSRKLIGEILVEQKWCSPEQVTETLAAGYGIPYVKLTPRLPDPKVVSLLPRAFLEKNRVLPLFKVEGVLTVATSEPADVVLLDEIARLTGCRVQTVAATTRDIVATLQTYLPETNAFVVDEVIDDLDVEKFSPVGGPAGTPPVRADDPAVGRLVKYCIYHAVRDGAAEIHLEPLDGQFRIRYRIDGRLTEKLRPPASTYPGVLAQLKWMAQLNAAESRRPQEGLIRLLIDRRPVALRLATAPGRHGEKLVLRISNSDRGPLHLEKLGFAYETFKQWRKLITQQHGLLLVTGPAGSGKRTTLYSALRELNAGAMNLCTVEDPVELTLDGVNQFQVDESNGFSFPAAIRSIVQQNPDVLMLGDVRDAETARAACQSALDGRLVLASVTAADIPSAIARLLHLGVEPYLVGATLTAVLSQRLVRKLCPTCKEPHEPTPAQKKQLDRLASTVESLYHPKGCPRCNQLGYSGRIGLHELLVVADALTQRLSQGPTLAELRDLLRQFNVKSLRTDGFEKARAGITTLDEVLRVTA